MKHFIYHVIGLKVGCTQNYESRRKNYPGMQVELIEVLEGLTHQEAGDREWYWAEVFGYLLGTHYANAIKGAAARKGSHWTDEQRASITGREPWNKGVPMEEEQKAKLRDVERTSEWLINQSLARKGKNSEKQLSQLYVLHEQNRGKSFWNNGIISCKSALQPGPEFKPGRIPFTNKAMKEQL